MRKPIRILHIIGTMNRGGAETFVMELYRHIDRTRIQFDYFIYSDGVSQGVFDDEIIRLGGKIYYAKKRLYRGLLGFEKELYDFAKVHNEYYIIHSHLNMRGGFILSAFKAAGHFLTIAHSHTAYPHRDIKNKTINMTGRLLLKRSTDFYFACSEEAMQVICKREADNVRRFILYNAVNVEKYAFSYSNRLSIRKELNIGDDTFVIMHIGRFTSEKNHVKTIDVFREIIKKRTNSVLVLVGQGDLLDDMKQYANTLNLSEKIIFTGARGDVNELLSAADVFLFPSLGEGLGIVLIEAQANGLPCIISRDVIPEMVDVQSDLIRRVGLEESEEEWSEKCLHVRDRAERDYAIAQVKKAGYDVNEVALWLQNFYLDHWQK